MNLKGVRESTNFEDRTGAPWYDPNKLLGNVIIAMSRMVGSKKQAELDAIQKERDANPIAPMSPKEQQANMNARVTRDPGGKGWIIKTPGKTFDEYAPDYVDSNVIQSVLKQAGLAK